MHYGSPTGGTPPVSVSISASRVAFSPDKSNSRASIAATFSLIFARLRRADSRFFSARIALSSSSVIPSVAAGVTATGAAATAVAPPLVPPFLRPPPPPVIPPGAVGGLDTPPPPFGILTLGRTAARALVPGVGRGGRAGAGRLPRAGPWGGGLAVGASVTPAAVHAAAVPPGAAGGTAVAVAPLFLSPRPAPPPRTRRGREAGGGRLALLRGRSSSESDPSPKVGVTSSGVSSSDSTCVTGINEPPRGEAHGKAAAPAPATGAANTACDCTLASHMSLSGEGMGAPLAG